MTTERMNGPTGTVTRDHVDFWSAMSVAVENGRKIVVVTTPMARPMIFHALDCHVDLSVGCYRLVSLCRTMVRLRFAGSGYCDLEIRDDDIQDIFSRYYHRPQIAALRDKMQLLFEVAPAEVCPDCKGTRVYVGIGFFPAEPCRRCQSA